MIINLIIAHRHPVFVVILQNLLQSYQGLHVIGAASTADSLLEATSRLKPDVIIADIALPGMKDFTALQQLATTSQAKIILSWNRKQQAAIRKAMLTGHAGGILQDTNPIEYYLGIQEAVKGNMYYCSETQKVIDIYKKLRGGNSTKAPMLNEKYLILIYSMWLGYKNKETAKAAMLTKKTIDTYRKNLKKEAGSLSFSAIETLMKKYGLI
jgi:two-component system response regulator NreC